MTAIIFLALRIILSVCLYAFILFLFYHLWKENDHQGDRLSRRRIPTLTLAMKRTDAPDRTRYFESDEVLIGRDEKCDFQLVDENVSNHHARLRFHHAQWWLEDLGSKNGTLINGQRLITPVVVITGDEIMCGTQPLTITISGEYQSKPSKKEIRIDNGENND